LEDLVKRRIGSHLAAKYMQPDGCVSTGRVNQRRAQCRRPDGVEHVLRIVVLLREVVLSEPRRDALANALADVGIAPASDPGAGSTVDVSAQRVVAVVVSGRQPHRVLATDLGANDATAEQKPLTS